MRKKIIVWVCFMTILAGVASSPSVMSKTKIALTKKRIFINVDEKYTLKVNGSPKKVKWSSNRKKVAKVNKKGIVTGIKPGVAKITAKVRKKKLTCRVKVTIKTIPGSTAAPTEKTTANKTTKPTDSLLDAKTENPSSSDEGWVPGWY